VDSTVIIISDNRSCW